MWFDRNAEEAVTFYTSIFKNSKIVSIKKYPDGPLEGPMKGFEGKVLTAVFELEGQRFMALDGGPIFKPTEATSFYVECETQEEVDHYWKKLSAVPESEQCGWLKDKYGVSWQIAPNALDDMLANGAPEQVERVIAAFMRMKKFNVAELEKAYNGQ